MPSRRVLCHAAAFGQADADSVLVDGLGLDLSVVWAFGSPAGSGGFVEWAVIDWLATTRSARCPFQATVPRAATDTVGGVAETCCVDS